MKLTDKDEAKLRGLHPDLVRVVRRAVQISTVPFAVTEGMRTIERQRKLVAKGASKTLNSRHLTGHAIDIVPLGDDGQPSWDWPLYYPLAKVIKQAAKDVGVPIEWGGDWVKFKDGPHWQLPWRDYPSGPPVEAIGEPRMTDRRVDDLAKSRTVQGSAAAAAGGVAVLADVTTQLERASDHLVSGRTLGLIIATLIIGGAAYALYARWDDAGRPLPWRR